MPTYKRIYRSKGKADKTMWCFQFVKHGKKWSKCGFPTMREAELAESRVKHELHSKRIKPLRLADAVFDDFAEKFVSHRMVTRAPGTVQREARRLTPAIRFFHNRRLLDITAGDIHDYVAKRKGTDGLANRSINLELTLLRSMFRHAIDYGAAYDNPAKNVTNLRVETDKKWIPSEQQFEQFVAEAAKTPSASVLVPWIWFRAYTGTRPKESVFVEWKDIDFENEQIYIRPKTGNLLKSGKFRVVEMHAKLKPILLAWRQEWEAVFAKRHHRHPDEPSPPHDWVFFNPYDQIRRATSFFRSFYLARERAGVPKLTSHTLRHYFISYCVMNEIDFFTIARWVGHRNTRMIEEVYGHLSPTHRRKQMAKLCITVAEPPAAAAV